MTNLGNIAAVARREYTVRVRTRSFIFGTLVLLVAVLAIAFAPIIIRAIDLQDEQKIAVHVATSDLTSDPVATLSALLNATTDTGAATADRPPDYAVVAVPDLGRRPAGRGCRRVLGGPGDRSVGQRRPRVHPLHERQCDRPDGRAHQAGLDGHRRQRSARATRGPVVGPGDPVHPGAIRGRVAGSGA